jgi:cell division septal protein FtsQ
MKPRPAIRNKRVSNTRQRKQQHLLEVTIRRDIARKQQTRKAVATICRLIFFIALCAGAIFGGKEALRRFLWENPDYFLTDLRVSNPDGALTREQILTAADLAEGCNIFKVDLGKARAAIDRLPQVERVEIQRVLPNRVNINIVERKPIAWAADRVDEDPSSSEKAFLIDSRGVVMRSKRMLPEYLLLPIISGVPLENLAPGQMVKSFEMQAALDLIRLNVESTRFQIRNIDISKGYCLVVTDRDHMRVIFGLDRVDQQQARLDRLLDHILPQQREIQTVNLLVERNTPVTFAETPLPAPVETPFAAETQMSNGKEKFLTAKEKPVTPAATPVASRKERATATPPPRNTEKPATSAARSRGNVMKKPFKP